MKIKKIIKCFFVMIIYLFCNSLEVKANTIISQFKETFIPTYSYVDKKGKWGNFEYFQRTSDGHIAYCIQPGTPLAKNTNYNGYFGTSSVELASKVNLTVEQLIKISRIAHYGWGYGGHSGNHWIVATQVLIWEETGRTIQFTRMNNPSNPYQYVIGVPSEVQSAMDEINRLVDEHDIQPTFQSINPNILYGTSYNFIEQAGILNRFSVKHCENCNATIQNNNLVVTPTSTNSGYVSLSKQDNAWSHEFIVYHSDIGQDMIVAGNLDPVEARVRFNVISGKINLKKYDIENKSCIPRGQATLDGAVYGLYKSNGELYKEITINNDCSASIGNLPISNYYIKEIKAPMGYELDSNRYYIYFNENNQEMNLELKEQVIKNHISILKQYDYIDGNTSFLNAEQNITFEIFYPDGRKYDEIITDKNGYALIDLPYGTWQFHQLNTTAGFEKIYDFFITVDENSNKNQYYNILNNSLSAYLKVIKVDSETKEVIAIANTNFKILNLDTNQYVSQFVGGTIISDFKTDEFGVMITPLKLQAGNYKLIEVLAPNGYLKDNEGLLFTIGSDTHYQYTTYGAFITLNYNNTPIKGQIEVHKKGEDFIIKDGQYFYGSKDLSGVIFNIYALENILSSDKRYLYYKKDDLIDTLITNEDGYAISNKLPLGKYYLIESETQDGYILDKKRYYITLQQIDDKTSVVYESYSTLNYLKKSTLEFTKIDLLNGNVIPNTIIEIYTEKDELIFTGNTDENGKIVINDLKIGKYYILEKEPSVGYLINKEKVYFEIKENGELVKTEMKNEKIIIEVPNTFKNDNLMFGIISLIVLSSGVVIYGTIKNKKKNNK